MAEMSALSRKIIQNMAETLCKNVKQFNLTETECLIRLFNTLLAEQTERKAANGLDRGKFRNILHNTFGLTDDMILDRVFRAFDKDNDGYVSVKEWIEGLSVYLRGTLDEKIKCKDYDFDSRLSYSDFENAVKNENLLLEAFGSCLPDTKNIQAFEQQAFQDVQRS